MYHYYNIVGGAEWLKYIIKLLLRKKPNRTIINMEAHFCIVNLVLEQIGWIKIQVSVWKNGNKPVFHTF